MRTTTHTRPVLDIAGCDRPESAVKPRKCLAEVGAPGGCAPHKCRSKLGPRRKCRAVQNLGPRLPWERQRPFRNLTKRGLHRLCAPTETSNRAEAGHSTPAAAAAAEAPAAAGGRFQGRRGSRLCSHGGRVGAAGYATHAPMWRAAQETASYARAHLRAC